MTQPVVPISEYLELVDALRKRGAIEVHIHGLSVKFHAPLDTQHEIKVTKLVSDTKAATVDDEIEYWSSS